MSIYQASKSPHSQFNVIPTGLASLDKLIGVGGIPFKKIFEISGNYSVGKSTLAMTIVAEAQKNKVNCLWADTEYSWDDTYAQTLGVDTNALSLCQTHFAEEMLDEIEEWASKNKNSLIVLDSIGNLLPRAEAEKGAEGKVIGGQAKLVSVFCRKIIPILAINNIALIVCNHQFTDIMSGKLKTSGGAKLEYARSVWLMLRKANKRVMHSEAQIGDIIEAEIRKNKVANTKMQKIELTLIYGEGFAKGADLMQESLDKGIITKQGQFYYFAGGKVARGQNGLRELFKDEVFSNKIKELL